MLRMILMCTVLVMGTPCWAQETPQAAAPPPEKKICKSIVPTGSIMAKKFCLTKTEWAKFNDINDQGSSQAFRNRRSIGCGKMDSPMAC